MLENSNQLKGSLNALILDTRDIETKNIYVNYFQNNKGSIFQKDILNSYAINKLNSEVKRNREIHNHRETFSYLVLSNL